MNEYIRKNGYSWFGLKRIKNNGYIGSKPLINNANDSIGY